jgi:hypothetical protein
MAAQMEQVAVTAELEIEEADEFQASQGGSGWSGQSPVGVGVLATSVMQVRTMGAGSPLTPLLQPLERLEALGINKGDIKKARDGGKLPSARSSAATAPASVEPTTAWLAPNTLQDSTHASLC